MTLNLLSCPDIAVSMVKEVHAAHILVKTDKKAKEVLDKINHGLSFTEAARKYSDCPSGKSGGDLGWFGKSKMVQEFEKAAFEGEKGKLLGPVKTQFGYHIIKVLDRK
jgi:peptidyl-prolyl cis-trans isomerase C